MIFECSLCDKGVGDLGSSVPALVTSGGQIAAGVVPSVLVSTGAIAAGSALVPVIGAAIAGVTLAVGLFLNRNAEYFAQAKATTGIVNEAEVYMKQNLAAWQSSDKTKADQQQAIDNFNTLWSQVVQACSSPQYGGPGQRCVSDRQRGGQWDWFSYYLDPIAGDPNVKPDKFETATNDVVSGVTGAIANLNMGSLLPILLLGGLGIWAMQES